MAATVNVSMLFFLMVLLRNVRPSMYSYKEPCPMKIVSYNTGLTGRVPAYEERRQAMPDAFIKQDADVMCLQEVWYGHDVQHLVSSVKDTYPFSYSYLHSDDGELRLGYNSPCAGISFLTFAACLKLKCSNSTTTDGEYGTCASEVCGAMDLDQECITCLAITPSNHALSSCFFTMSTNMNIPGLLMLSKRPLRSRAIKEFLPNIKAFVPRSYMETSIDGLGKTVCTHLTAYQESEYYEPLLLNRYKSWGDQNLDEAELLMSVTEADDRVTVMGDLNCGPRTDSNTGGLHDESFKKLTERMSSKYVENTGRCTFCEDSPLRVEEKGDFILDHILVRGSTVTTDSRIFDDNIPGHDCPLSDHYGVQMTIE